MKNTLTDLNNYLFETIERLNDDELTEEQLKNEIKRAKAIGDVAGQIVETGRLQLAVIRYEEEYCGSNIKLPVMLGGG